MHLIKEDSQRTVTPPLTRPYSNISFVTRRSSSQDCSSPEEIAGYRMDANVQEEKLSWVKRLVSGSDSKRVPLDLHTKWY